MSNFKTVKISDPRISNCTDKLAVAVFSGPAEITSNKFKANSAGASNWSFQCNIPSPSTVIDRNVYIGSTVNFQITIGPVGAQYGDQRVGATKLTGAQIPLDELCIDIGGSDGLQAFPLNQLFSNASVTINNSSTSIQTQSILQALLRSSSAKVLAKYNGGCPALSDRFYLNYADALASASTNVLADVEGSTFSDGNLMTRGAHPITFTSIVHNTFTYGGGAANANNNPAVDASLISAGVQDSWVIGLSTVLYEPLIGLSPFLWEGSSSKYNSQGLYGVNACSFNFTIDSTLSRFWSACNYPSPSGWSIALGNTVSPTPFTNVFIYMKFLTIQPSDAERLPLKNIVPYTNWTQYITSGLPPIPYTLATNTKGTATLNTISMSLAVVPDLIYVMVRIPQAQMNPFLSSAFMTITGVVCQFNNRSGLLANYSSLDLYNLSVKNGLQDCSYNEWSGGALWQLTAGGIPLTPGTANVPPSTLALANTQGNVNMAGSLLILSPVDFGIPDWCSPGLSGQFLLQFQLSVQSNYNGVYIAGGPVATMPYTPIYNIPVEVDIIVQESGLFITESGQSSIEIAMLSKDDILDSKGSTEHIPNDAYNEEVGGSIHNRNRSALKGFPKHHHAHHIHRHEEHGGAMSAGAHHSRKGKLSKYVV